MDNGVDRSRRFRQGAPESTDTSQISKVAHQRSDAVARFCGGGVDPRFVRTHGEDPEPGLPQHLGHGDPGRSAAAGDQDIQWDVFGHRAEAPVMPAVDSMTGRIFFSNAS